MFQSIVSQCLNSPTTTLLNARTIHAHFLKFNLFTNTQLTTSLLTLYSHFLPFSHLTPILSSLPHPTIFSFSSIIHSFARSHHFRHVLGAFSQLGSLGLVPDSYLLPSAIKACAVLKELKPGRQVLFYLFF